MSLARLVVHLQANYKSLTAGLGVARNDVAKTVANIVSAASSLEAMKGKVGDVSAEYQALVDATAEFVNSTDLAGDAADFLRIKLRYIEDTMARLTGQTDRFEKQLTSAVASFQLRLLTDALRKQGTVTEQIKRLWQGNQNALVKYNQTAAQTTRLHQQMSQPKPMPQQQSSSRAMIKYQGGGNATGSALQLAGIVMQAKAASSMSTAMMKARSAVATVSTAIKEVAAATNSSVSAMDRFRVGLTAAKVNPALNTLPGIIQNIAGKAAKAVENFRGFGDATIAGIPAILTSIAGGMGSVMGAGDSLQATVSKITSQMDLKRQALDRVAKIYPTAGTAVDLFKTAMDFIAPQAEKVAQKVDLANDAVRQGTIWARNFAYMATGSFVKTGTSADAYARGVYHALLPTRLMMFESKFAQGSLTLMRRAVVAITHPIHAMAMASARTRGEFRELRNTLPPLTGGLQLGTRAFRAFAHATYFTSTAGRAIWTLATPVTFVGKKLWELVRPAKAAKAGLDGVATGGHKAGIAFRGVAAAAGVAATAIGKAGSAARSSMSGWMSAIPGKAAMGATAVAALGVAMVGMGVNTAIATEKNQAVFGTMVHNMEQGKAIVDSIQGTKAAGLFDNQELLDSSRLLFKAGVSAKNLAGKTDQLAKIAVGTTTDISDLARIYQQGANSGSFGQDKINQLAERGIAIYQGLEHATGKSDGALKEMISDGKIGIAEMDSALAFLTTGTGYYTNALTDVGNTTGGMMSQIKNNVMQALGKIMGAGTAAGRPFLEMLVSWSAAVKTHAATVAPIVSELTGTIKGLFTGLYDVVSTVWTSIFGVTQTTYAGMLGGTMEWVTKFRWFFTNLVPIVQFVGMQLLAILLGVFNDISYWFTDTMPAYLTWFSNNWQNVFRDLAVGTMTIFSNLTSNIKNAMSVIWEFIKSGGTSGLEFTWTPLLDGFKATVAELPDVPDRAMTALEQGMQEQIQVIGTDLADSFDAMMAESSASMAAAANVPPPVPLSDSAAPPASAEVIPSETGKDKVKKSIAENKAVQVASAEGQSVVTNLLKGLKQNDDKAAKKAQIDSAKHLEKLARDSDRAPRLIVENWA